MTAVGGTQLARARNARGWTETVYNGNGASRQRVLGLRGQAALAARPALPRPDRRRRGGARLARGRLRQLHHPPLGGPWLTVYGTSAAAPIVAGVYALAGNAATIGPGYEYAHAAALFDVTKGNNDWFQGTGGAVCGHDYLCVAKPGYDGPTGLGTPDGTGAF